MRRTSSFLMSILVVAGAMVLGQAASAQDVQSKLSDARRDQGAAQSALQEARDRLRRALDEYRGLQSQLTQTAIDLVASYGEEDRLDQELLDAQAALDRRATDAYEAGPTLAIELFLGSSTPGDFASAQEFAGRAFAVDDETVSRVTTARQAIADLTERRRQRQRDLGRSVEHLETLAAQADAAVAAATAEADAAGVTVTRLEAEAKALAEARAAAMASLDRLVDASRGKDQSALLALLGPNQGKGCAIPTGLTDTGQRVNGQSSWYGWDFAGQATASGAIFDPNLFTAANKELPLGVFLRMHYNGKCAIVLVNDRGPYGVEGRLFDVAEAVALYLGFKGSGVADVTTDVLVPSP